MKSRLRQVTCSLLAFLALRASAATLYVSLNSTNPIPPYANWSTAATNIQDAVDASTNGDLILVTNGIYANGGRAISGYTLMNRVAVTNAVTLQSVNGPAVTFIQGSQVPGTITGDGAVRCVYLASSAVLSGFTLTNGATRGAAGDPKLEQPGGGAYCESYSSVVISNCVQAGNAAYLWGGGCIYGSLYNCVVRNNSAGSGGGTYLSRLYNCTVASNYASGSGGGATRGILNNCTVAGNSAGTYGGGFDGNSDGTLNNCIVYFNYAPTNPNWYRGSFNAYGSVNYCCTVPYSTNGPGNIANNPQFENSETVDYYLQSNSPCLNAGNNSYVSTTIDLAGKARVVHGTVDMGAYEFQGNIRYVSLGSTNPIAPYSDWSIAATNIQDAVDAASAGETVLVTNGIYASGGRLLSRADVTNRVSVTNAVSVRSVNGPAVTVIQGYQVPGTIASTSAVRCAYVGNGALLSGFTLTNGEAGTGNYVNGGGISGVISGTVSNCVLAGNICAGAGGGANGVTLIDCLLTGNYGVGGGAASWSDLLRCTLTNNVASWAGGLLSSQATNCLIAANSATNYGGGSGFSTLVDCTVAANFLAPGHGGNGGGSYHDTLFNCIVYNNAAPNGSNYYSSAMQYCCTAPPPGGTANIANAPLMVNQAGGDFHLSSDSPCINSGNNAYIISSTDLDGNPRIAGGTVDIGAYEYQTPASRISYAWLQQYGLPIIANTDSADQDGDHMNNYQEWIAGTDPTNALSLLEMFNPAVTNNSPGLFLSWQSVSGRTYFLQRSTNLEAQTPFSTIQNNLVGQAGTTGYTDTNATGSGPFFYRVGVQQ